MELPKYITRWLKPDERFISQYGQINNREWLVKEKDRIERDKSRKVEILTRGPGDGMEECLANI